MRLSCFAALLFLFLSGSSQAAPLWDDEFAGPFANWANVRDYGAKGDGQHDDSDALQKALDDLRVDGKSKVLWIPAGTYRITKTLVMTSHINIGVFGEDPARTIIKWDGAEDGVMLDCNGVRYSRFGRLTWDGQGKALTAIDHAWDGKTPGANTHNQHEDEWFQNVGFGVRGGRRGVMDAECAMLRCRFQNCSKAGLSVENFNALDWFIWDSLFENCRVGVTNEFGAGNFGVYNSLFRGSSEADVTMSNCQYFSLRGNTSIGSKAFFIARNRSCAGLTTLQNNRILDATGEAPLQLGNVGPYLLLDNTIRARIGAKVPLITYQTARTLLAVGNKFSQSGAIATPPTGEQYLAVDNFVIPREKTNSALPVLPSTLPLTKRRIFEITPDTDIQKNIDQAARLRGQKPILHFASGDYAVTKTLTIPANCDVQLTGDGYASRLMWKGEKGGTLLKLAGPTRATLRDLTLHGNDTGTGLLAVNCDQGGSRIWMEQGEVQNGKDGLIADGLDNARLELRDFYHSGVKGVAVKSIGGPRLSAGKPATTSLNIFGGASSNNELSYDVQNGGRIVATDIWYEGAPPRFINFTDKSRGSFTLNGATTATGRPGPNQEATDPNFAALQIEDGFRGDVALLNVIIGTKFGFTRGQKIEDVPYRHRTLLMTHGQPGFYSKQSSRNLNFAYGCTVYTEGGGAKVWEGNDISTSAAFVTKMLAPLRAARPQTLVALPRGVTDLRLYRVNAENFATNIHLKGRP